MEALTQHPVAALLIGAGILLFAIIVIARRGATDDCGHESEIKYPKLTDEERRQALDDHRRRNEKDSRP